MSQNQLTFLPVSNSAKETTILYYSATTEKWHDFIEAKYTAQFRVIPLKLEENDNQELCGDNCHFYNTRFEADNLIWLFLFIGYLAVIDCIVNLFYNLVVIQECKQMQDEDNVTSGVTSGEMELNVTIRTPFKNQVKKTTNASLVYQNYESEQNEVNAEKQEMLTKIRKKKLATM